jgi:hypothetical protein
MERLLAIGRWFVLAPIRFLNWVYDPAARRRGPSRAEALVHIQANGIGLETTKWMSIETDERRRQEEEALRVR